MIGSDDTSGPCISYHSDHQSGQTRMWWRAAGVDNYFTLSLIKTTFANPVPTGVMCLGRLVVHVHRRNRIHVCTLYSKQSPANMEVTHSGREWMKSRNNKEPSTVPWGTPEVTLHMHTYTHANTRTHDFAHAHARTHTHARTHARTHANAHAHRTNTDDRVRASAAEF